MSEILKRLTIFKILFFIIISYKLEIIEARSRSKTFAYLSKDDRGNIFYKGHYKIGSKYKIDHKIYYPRKVSRYKKITLASWYGQNDHGKKKTANGDIFNANTLTAAHKTLPIPSMVRVTNLENNKKIILMINDRGPFIDNREIDLSEKAAKILKMHKSGIAKVLVEYLPRETEQMLKILALTPKHGAKAKIQSQIKDAQSIVISNV